MKMRRFSKEIRDLPISDLRKLAFQNRLDVDPGFDHAMNDDITDEFFGELQSRKDNNANTILETYGIGGSGKTYSNHYIAHFLCPEYAIGHCFFRLEEILHSLDKFPKGSAVLFDEKTREYGQGSIRRMSQYENLIQVVRKFQLSLLNCAVVPRMKDLAHYELESLFIDYKRRIVRVAVQYPKITSMAYQDFRTIGYAEIPHPEKVLPPTFLKDYEEQKDRFISEHMLTETGDFTIDSAMRVMESDDFQMLFKEWMERKNPRVPPKRKIFEIVAQLFPELKRNNEARDITESVICECEKKIRGHGKTYMSGNAPE